MHDYIHREIEERLLQNLRIFPAVALLGSRQCGKSTLTKVIAEKFPSFIYLDLQNYQDLNKLTDPYLFFKANEKAVICLDEVQLKPELFSVLRSEIDRERRPGRFILLGSASRDLVQHTSESLAGRVGLINLTPFSQKELSQTSNLDQNKHWTRGGFPDSYLADGEVESTIWRENFIRTYIERDIPQLGFQIPALQLRRLLTMLAHNQGQLLNASKLGESLSLTHPTIKRYLDLLEQTFIVRSLPPYEANIKKRLVKSPKVYIRDSGLLHQLLHIADFNQLLGNPVFGASWEGYAIENITSTLYDWNASFYRTSTGDEIDLILEKGLRKIAIECKGSTAPQVSKGFWNVLDDVKPEKTFIIAPIETSYPYKDNVWVTGINDLFKLIESQQ